MSDNSQKTPLSNTLNEFARRKAADAIQQTGRSLPATVVSAKGSIVTVKFEITNTVFTLPNVTIPLFGPEYIRYPIQTGDKGFVVAADAYLGGMSGLGGGTADLTQLANLAALVFFPIGNTSFFAVDPQAVVIYGPNGVVIRDTTNASNITLTPQTIDSVAPQRISHKVGAALITEDPATITLGVGASVVTIKQTAITLQSGGHSIIINATGVIIDGKVFLTHEHTGVQGGSGVTGPVL
jgi:hypothetical protein